MRRVIKISLEKVCLFTWIWKLSILPFTLNIIRIYRTLQSYRLCYDRLPCITIELCYCWMDANCLFICRRWQHDMQSEAIQQNSKGSDFSGIYSILYGKNLIWCLCKIEFNNENICPWCIGHHIQRIILNKSFLIKEWSKSDSIYIYLSSLCCEVL